MSRDIILELYKKQAKIIYGFLLKNGCSKEDAEDIIQDSFIKAIRYIDGVDYKKVNSWLFTVTLNNYRNRIKRKSKIIELKIDEQSFLDSIASEDNLDERILKKENASMVKACLGDLKQTYRDLLILKYDMELSYKAISQLSGMSEDVVKTYLYRARLEFKKRWEEYYER